MNLSVFANPVMWVIAMIMAVIGCYAALWTGIGCRWICTQCYRHLTRSTIHKAPAPAAIAGSKAFAIQEIEARNARCRAQWTEKFHSRAQCSDAWPVTARMYIDLRLEDGRRRARRWIAAGEAYRRAQAIEKAENVICLATRADVQRLQRRLAT